MILCTALYVLLLATRHGHFQRLFIITRRHHSFLELKKQKQCNQIDILNSHIETGSVQ